MDENKREHLKAAFQADLDRDPVRILLATDAASEGIDLQRHCHRVIHYDIPFNPNRLEQRIGRVDRHGQTHEVEVSHFVGAGWDKEPEGSYAGDLEYLSRVAQKVATERQDLGSVNPVLAHAVEARMLGRPQLIDPLQVTPKASTSLLRAERDLRDQVRKLHDQLDASIRELHVAPANVRRVVDTALALADQPPLADEPDGLIAPPTLRAGWERTVTGLADPLDGHLRPLTFDAKVAEGRDDVVLAHLEYPLVAQATRLLRSAIWGGRVALNRVAALKFTPPADAGVNGPLVAVFARLVLVGADGRRLHEEIMLSARIVPPTGRSRRVELEERRHEALHAAVEAALEPDACRLAPEAARLDFADRGASSNRCSPATLSSARRSARSASSAPSISVRPPSSATWTPCSPSSGRTWIPRSMGRERCSSPSTSSMSLRSTRMTGTARRGPRAATASPRRSSASLTRSGGATRTSANWSSRSRRALCVPDEVAE